MSTTAEIGTDLSSAAGAAGLGIWHCLEGRFRLDPQAARLLVTANDAPDESQFLALIHDSDQPAVRQALHEQIFQGGDCDVDFRRKDGVWLRMRGGIRKPGVAHPAF